MVNYWVILEGVKEKNIFNIFYFCQKIVAFINIKLPVN